MIITQFTGLNTQKEELSCSSGGCPTLPLRVKKLACVGDNTKVVLIRKWIFIISDCTTDVCVFSFMYLFSPPQPSMNLCCRVEMKWELLPNLCSFTKSGKELLGEKWLVSNSLKTPQMQQFLFPLCRSGSEYSDCGLYDKDHYLLSL